MTLPAYQPSTPVAFLQSPASTLDDRADAPEVFPGETRAPIVHQFVDDVLGNSSYVVVSASTGLAAIVDPRRDIDDYIDLLRRNGWTLRFAIDTHLHADFVSGSRELAAWARQQQPDEPFDVGMSAQAQAGDVLPLKEGWALSFGDVSLKVIATPGHAPEHISFLLRGPRGPHDAVFSGGALTPGGAARTDLLGDRFRDALATRLYLTMHRKLLALADETVVYPTHFGGSFCTTTGGSDTTTTIGHERLRNPLALARNRVEFVELATRDLVPYPAYFRQMRAVNRTGAPLAARLPAPIPMPVDAVWRHCEAGGVVLDVREPEAFAKAHLPESLGIPLATPVATWAGWVLPLATPIALVGSTPGEVAEAGRQLRLVGFDTIVGHLDGGLPAWEAAGLPVRSAPYVDAAALRASLQEPGAPLLLDVRFKREWDAGHIPDAAHIEAPRFIDGELPPYVHGPIVVQCGAGNRATVVLSLLERRGFTDVSVLEGGFGAWAANGFEVINDD